MSIRSININPSDLSIKPKKDKKTKKTSTLTEPITINSTNIRKLLLEKLKEHKKTQKNIVLNKDNFDSKVPNYSNLKNGTKPTYRELQKMNISPIQPVPLLPPLIPPPAIQPQVFQPPAFQPEVPTPAIQPPVLLPPMVQPPAIQPPAIQPPAIPLLPPIIQPPAIQPMVQPVVDIFNIPSNEPYVQEREIKKTFHLGKNAKNNTINVLIKSNKTRKNVEHMKSEMKKTKINTIKNYLKTKNLIKFGTSAPSGLLKEIYESSKLCGEVYNNNANTLIHNYNINNNS